MVSGTAGISSETGFDASGREDDMRDPRFVRPTIVTGGSAPALHRGPELGERAKFWSLADVDVDVTFQRIGIVRGPTDILDVLPEFFERFFVVVQNNHAIALISPRPPQEVGLMAAQGRVQAIAATQEIDGASLAVILGEDAAIAALRRTETVPGLRGFG